jgi:Ca2+-binding RTX toxin-like protein
MGMGGDDTLTGGSGNDLLSGGTGRDILFGGAGVDIATFSGVRANFLIANAANGLQVSDRVGDQSVDVLHQVEWLMFDDGALRISDMTFLATSAVNGVFSGPTTFNMGSQLVMTGTAGADTFAVTVLGTVVQGLAGADVVNTTVDFTLPQDVERLNLIGTAAINGTGSSLSDKIYGNAAANLIAGAAGNDSLYGNAGNDRLLGGDGFDSLYGGAGNDVINGGAGRDLLKGAAGADVFVFTSLNDSSKAAPDAIQDFASGVDFVDLRGIDANSGVTGNQAFVFNSGPSGAGALWFSSGNLYGDVNGDGVADLAIVLGSHPIKAWDILL